MKTLLLTSLLALAAMPALAQDARTGPVVVIPAADIARRVNAAATSVTITTTDKYISLFSHRTVDGTPERHANWTDVMVVQQGEVTLTTGGTLSGNTVDANGESHGGTLTGGITVVVHPGDYLQIPAGVPHLMTNPRGDFHYFVTKVHV
jgi:mannose-6-phosphate isomerase-like protein (cupin superfamily)